MIAGLDIERPALKFEVHSQQYFHTTCIKRGSCSCLFLGCYFESWSKRALCSKCLIWPSIMREMRLMRIIIHYDRLFIKYQISWANCGNQNSAKQFRRDTKPTRCSFTACLSFSWFLPVNGNKQIWIWKAIMPLMHISSAQLKATLHVPLKTHEASGVNIFRMETTCVLI